MFVGTLYPLALEALTGEKISVGAPFFNRDFRAAVSAAAVRACRLGRCWPGSAATCYGVAQRLMAAFGIGIVAIAVTFAAMGMGSVLAPFGIGPGVLRHGWALSSIWSNAPGCSACRLGR